LAAQQIARGRRATAAVAVEPTAGRRMAKIRVKMSVKPLWKKEIFPAVAQSNN
jgi:hypothetical protein